MSKGVGADIFQLIPNLTPRCSVDVPGLRLECVLSKSLFAIQLRDEVLAELELTVQEVNVIEPHGPQQSHKRGVKLTLAQRVKIGADYVVEQSTLLASAQSALPVAHRVPGSTLAKAYPTFAGMPSVARRRSVGLEYRRH